MSSVGADHQHHYHHSLRGGGGGEQLSSNQEKRPLLQHANGRDHSSLNYNHHFHRPQPLVQPSRNLDRADRFSGVAVADGNTFSVDDGSGLLAADSGAAVALSAATVAARSLQDGGRGGGGLSAGGDDPDFCFSSRERTSQALGNLGYHTYQQPTTGGQAGRFGTAVSAGGSGDSHHQQHRLHYNSNANGAHSYRSKSFSNNNSVNKNNNLNNNNNINNNNNGGSNGAAKDKSVDVRIGCEDDVTSFDGLAEGRHGGGGLANSSGGLAINGQAGGAGSVRRDRSGDGTGLEVGASSGSSGDGGGNSSNSSSTTAICAIPLPAAVERSGGGGDQARYRPEKCKTLVAFVFAVACLILNLFVLAYVHDRVPDRDKVPPLPDVFFDLFPAIDVALDVSEVIIITSVWSCIALMLLHRHRWIVFRRVFAIVGVLYAMRALTMFVTQVPIASRTYKCSPKANSTSILIIGQRVLQLFSGFGLSINGQHTYCGDYIFSGHTLILTLSYLVIKEYSPQRCRLLHMLFFCTSFIGVFCVLLARGHYLIDVILGYYVTARVFWIYHSLCAALALQAHSSKSVLAYLSRMWWFPLFRYFEANVSGPVPRRYEWFLPWPRRWRLPRTRIS